YLVGQLLSLVSKHLERLTDRISKWCATWQNGKTTRSSSSLSKAKKEQDDATRGTKEIPIWEQYDWLRVNKSDAGALAVRIRAEYTMHYSCAAVIFLTAVGPAIRCVNFWIPWRRLFVVT